MFPKQLVEMAGGKVTASRSQQIVIDRIMTSLASGPATTDQDAAVQGGVCKGFSTMWIIQNHEGKNFWQWLDGSEAVPTLRRMGHQEANSGKIIKLAHAEMDKLPPNDPKRLAMQTQLNTAMEQKNNWAVELLRTHDLPPGARSAGKINDDLYDRLRELGNGYVMLSASKLVRRPDGTSVNPGHAMAVSVMNEKVIFMDPNAGQIEFADKESFAMFVPMYLDQCYQDQKWDDYRFTTFPTPVNSYEVQTNLQLPPTPVESEYGSIPAELPPLPRTPLTRRAAQKEILGPLPPTPVAEPSAS